ncbi:hypothetical protein, partial [Helicobacter sp. 11S02629-2]|uniref:hypothetical protein n=1 Tax=Helicobacter sp. 11S02629-2 TaxID=1476195 RepID=UPI000BD7C739
MKKLFSNSLDNSNIDNIASSANANNDMSNKVGTKIDASLESKSDKDFTSKANPLLLSSLSKTWLLDIDGTLLKHNGYKTKEGDSLLPGVKEFIASLSPSDKIVLLTAREESYIKNLKEFLKANNIRYDYLLHSLPVGERILVNDTKPSGLKCAYALNVKRDARLD